MPTCMARRLGAIAVLGTMGALLVSSPALGAVIRPNTFSDENGGGADCSSREAIMATNTDAAFGRSPAGGGGGPLAIRHAGVTPAVIDAGGIDRVIQVLGTRSSTASGLTIINGRPGQAGA